MTCRYADRIPREEYASLSDAMDFACHRMPPAALSDGDGQSWCEWPLMHAYDWCGEYEAEPVE